MGGMGGRGRGVFGCVCLFMVQHNFHLCVLTISNIPTPVSLSLPPPPLSLMYLCDELLGFSLSLSLSLSLYVCVLVISSTVATADT